MDWVRVEDELPKLKLVFTEKLTTIESSVECIVFDGTDVFVDYYTLDEGFHKSITDWVRVDSISKPNK